MAVPQDVLDTITPAEVHLLVHPSPSSSFFVRDGAFLLATSRSSEDDDEEEEAENEYARQEEQAALLLGETRNLQAQGELRPAGMSRGSGKWNDDEYRGDEIAWLSTTSSSSPSSTPSSSSSSSSDGSTTTSNTPPTLPIHPPSALHALLGRLEEIRDRIDTLDRGGPSPPLLNLDKCKRRSIQLAYYPGNGKRYVRHRDAFPADPQGEKGEENKVLESVRCLTVIYYLNAEWTPEQGGELRLFLEDGSEKEGGSEEGRIWDVAPILDRVVVFRRYVFFLVGLERW